MGEVHILVGVHYILLVAVELVSDAASPTLLGL
jgi:hypothetical protein